MAITDLARPASETGQARTKPASAVRTVLVHIQDSQTAGERIETALTVARAASAHVTCVHVTPIEAYVAFDNFGGVFVMSDVIQAIDEEAVSLRRKVEDDLRGEDVSWDYIHITGNVAGEVARYAALADLVVTGREPRKAELGRPAVSLLGDLLESLRTPLLIRGETPMDPTGPALIAWNGSFEAANAVRGSLGLLKLASSVKVLQVTGAPQQRLTFPGTRLLEYLSRQDIHAELVVESLKGAGDDAVAAAVISHARSTGAYVVMGGYGHSRVREFLFGGVTRTMLVETDVPVVIAR